MEQTIDLVRLEQEHLIEQLGPPPATPFGLHIVGAGHPAAELGRHLEREVFQEAFGNSPEMLAAEYDRYDAASAFLLVVDHRRKRPAGALRLIVPSPAGLKSLEDVRQEWGADPELLTREATGKGLASTKAFDIATLAVGREYRRAASRGLVSMAMWQAVGVLSFRCHVDLLVAIIDVRVLRLLLSKLTGVLEPFPGLEPQRYLDSAASVPVWSAPELWRARTAELDPELVQFMVEGGGGMDAIVSPPDWDEAAALLNGAGLVQEASAGLQNAVNPTAA